MKRRLFSISILMLLINASILFSSNEGALFGTFTSSFPYPYKFTILNDNEMKLEWTSPPDDHRYDQSKIYNYTLSKGPVFFQFLLSEDVPTSLWEVITGNPKPWNVGNVLLGLFGVVEDNGSGDEEVGKIMGVTYSTRSYTVSDIFTADVPNDVFKMHGLSDTLPMSVTNPSSELKEGETTYELRNLDLVRSDTAWVEGADGNGIGESFEAKFNKPPLYLAIINGYISASNPSLYWKNGRIKTVRIEGLTTGLVLEREVEDTPNLQTIDVRELGDETHARITIADVYPGELYSDTCLHFMSYSEYAIRPLSSSDLQMSSRASN